MNVFWNLIFVLVFVINSLDKTESVQLFDEIFGEGWWDNGKAEEWHKLTHEQTFHHQIDRQNTQLGQIEPNSTDQLGQIEPNTTDQNPPLTESDHSGQFEPNLTDQLGQIEPNSLEKGKIVAKFHEMKEELKQKGKYSDKERTRIEIKIAKHLKVNRKKIYKWKKEFGLSRKMFNEKERKHLIEKFDQRKAELKRDGFKNLYKNEIDKTAAKELGLSFTTIYAWKSDLGQTSKHKNSHSKQKELMKLYYEIKNTNPKISNENIAKMLKIGTNTLYTWKRGFKRQQMHPNSVDGHSVEENAAANVQEIGNSNSGSF